MERQESEKHFSVANLPESLVKQVQEIEQEISESVGDDIVLIAYKERPTHNE